MRRFHSHFHFSIASHFSVISMYCIFVHNTNHQYPALPFSPPYPPLHKESSQFKPLLFVFVFLNSLKLLLLDIFPIQILSTTFLPWKIRIQLSYLSNSSHTETYLPFPILQYFISKYWLDQNSVFTFLLLCKHDSQQECGVLCIHFLSFTTFCFPWS